LNRQDENFKRYILDISCRGRTHFNREDKEVLDLFSFPVLRQLESDGLVMLDDRSVEVTESGKRFIRNICVAFDLHLLQKNDAVAKTYSRAI